MSQVSLCIPELSPFDASPKNHTTFRPQIIIIIIIIILYGWLLSQAFSPRYFSWTNGDPHRSGFKFQTAVLSVLCAMFQV